MIGAIIGDIAGSINEFSNIKTKKDSVEYVLCVGSCYLGCAYLFERSLI